MTTAAHQHLVRVPTGDPDIPLLEQWRAGDEAAGQDLFGRHFPSVYRFFEDKCAGHVDDLVQRTFLQCVRSKDQFRAQSTFRTYLFAIARHELFHHLREVKRDPNVDFSVESVAAIVTTASSRLARAQEAEQLRQALRMLPADQQLLLELCFWHDLDSTQLGEVFEIPAATVRTRLFRARRALRELLEGRAMSIVSDEP